MIESQPRPDTDDPWPALPWRDWAPTVSTLHMSTQIVGNVLGKLRPGNDALFGANRAAPPRRDAELPGLGHGGYSREEPSVGWWPAIEPPGPAFYAYVYAEPDGFRSASIRPAGAVFDHRYGEMLLPHDVVCAASDPEASALEFFQTTHDAGADLAGWDRAILEPATLPGRPARGPWSVVRR